jgi:Ca2+-binding EF-hand superfamily protein
MVSIEQAVREAQENPNISLSARDIQEFREIFNLIDTDGSGCISPEELGALIEQVGLKITQEELDELVKEIDVDGSGEIDFQEFLETMSRDINPSYSPAEVCRAFKMFSRSAPGGMIKLKDLQEALQVYLHGKVDHHEIQSVLKAFEDSLVKMPDTDELYFNYMDYVNLMMPERPGSEDWIKRRSDAVMGADGGLEAALKEVHKEKEADKKKKRGSTNAGKKR